MIFSLLMLGWGAYASDWVLAAAPFDFTQKGKRDSSQEKIAVKLPEMILEQIGTNDTRLPPRSEMLDRKLDSLRTERLSLFLQLSEAIKVRDSLFLQEPDARKLERKIKEQQKKIADIQKKIDENLEDVEKSVAQIESELSGKPIGKRNFFESFSDFFSGKSEEKLVPDSRNESIRLYKNEASELFSPNQSVWKTGMDSLDFISAIGKENINGYLTGKLTFYSNYFSASVELWIYPGGKSAGSIMEVGHVDNLVQVARNISQYLRTLVVNSRPVNLYFDIAPEEARKNARVKIDGNLSPLSGNAVSVSAGIHTINVDCEGYESLATTYTFKDSTNFFVHIPMAIKQDGQFNVYLKNPMEGELFAGGKIIGDGIRGGTVTINGTPVIGQLRQTIPGVEGVDDEGNPMVSPDKTLGAFYYIPVELQSGGANLTVNVKPIDSAALIDSRRKWAYRGYSALILTLPVTFFMVGNYNTAADAYRAGHIDYGTAKGWEYARNGSIALTAVAGGFFIYELVRYLHAASSVLPANAKVSNARDLENVKTATSILEQKLAEKNDEDESVENGNLPDESTEKSYNETAEKK